MEYNDSELTTVTTVIYSNLLSFLGLNVDQKSNHELVRFSI